MIKYYALSFIFSIIISGWWIFYFWHKDKYEHEPVKKILKVFLISVVITNFVAIPEEIGLLFLRKFPSKDMLFLYFLFFVGFVEEFAKFIPVRYIIFKDKEFDEPVDGLIYTSVSAAGFMLVENIIYIYSGIMQGYGGMMTISRIISSPMHILFSAYYGYAMGIVKYFPEKSKSLIKRNFIIASILHGLFDFFIIMVLENLLRLLVRYGVFSHI